MSKFCAREGPQQLPNLQQRPPEVEHACAASLAAWETLLKGRPGHVFFGARVQGLGVGALRIRGAGKP